MPIWHLKLGRSQVCAIRFHRTGRSDVVQCITQPKGVQVNVEIMRTFVRLRQMLASNAELARKLDNLEKKYDTKFRVVFEAIRQLMAPPSKQKNKEPFGFHPKKKQ